MTRRMLCYGRIAALLLLGLCFGLVANSTPAAAGCGYGCGGYAVAPVVVQPYYSSCSCCGCGSGYGAYGYYAAPYAAYAEEDYYVAPRYYRPYRAYWGGWGQRRCC